MSRSADARKAWLRAVPVLRHVAEGKTPYTGAYGPGACSTRKRLLERLERDGLLLRSHGRWRLTDLAVSELRAEGIPC